MKYRHIVTQFHAVLTGSVTAIGQNKHKICPVKQPVQHLMVDSDHKWLAF